VGRRRSIPLLLIAVCLGLVACGSNKESQAEAKANLCSSLDNFKTTASSLSGLGLQSSEDDLKAASDKLNKAWDQVLDDAKDVKDVSTDKIRSAYDDLENAIVNRPTDQPVSQVVAGLQPKFTAFVQAWQDFASSLNCKSTS
jgi:hypothetical protein